VFYTYLIVVLHVPHKAVSAIGDSNGMILPVQATSHRCAWHYG
jgi:hypothetical protein